MELRRHPLDWPGRSPGEVLRLLREDGRPFALTGEWAGGGAVLGAAPLRSRAPGEEPFALLAAAGKLQGPPGAVGGGWFGVLGYGLADVVQPPAPVPVPDAVLAWYDHVLRLDPAGRWWFEELWTPARDAALAARRAELAVRPVPAPRPFAAGPFAAVPGRDGHERAVAAVRERIAHGDLYQANVCRRLEAALDGSALDLWTRAAAALDPPRAAYVAGDGYEVASLSPEVFLVRHGREVLSAPIKGTRPRPAGPAGERERLALLASEKDRAENVMIVDLVRNDLGRVCEPGSVRVAALAEARGLAGLWHLVSEVHGRLAPGAGDADLLRAAFPPGSVTGAPKLAALGAIAEVESTARGAYTGAVGFASPVAGLELSVAIRTFEAARGRIWLGVGGGITAGSEPADEAAETTAKAAPLLAAIGARLTAPERGGRQAPAAAGEGRPCMRPAVRRLGPRPLPRPDPARGVFTTLLALDGEPVALDAHVARLAASVRELYGETLPAIELPPLPAGRRRVRIEVRPGPRVAVRHAPAPAAAAVALATVTVPGGLGEHKWLDRRALDGWSSAVAPAVPLLVDLDGLVLEAARANVIAVLPGEGAVTPPLDGRILPGVGRATAVAALGARERALHRSELDAPGVAVLLTTALRGAETVAALDGRPLARFGAAPVGAGARP